MPSSRPSGPSSSTGNADALLRCADVLGSFGVTAADVRSGRGGSAGDTGDLATALADELAAGKDRTAVLCRTIAESERGLGCAARYAQDTLDRELAAVFDAIGWSFRCERIAAALRSDDRLHLRASDYQGRRRETTVEYPDTPLGTDNLPAILQAINASLLAGTDARFVLLSAGVDRWRAALVEEPELERLRERYGPRIDAVGTPLLPEYELGAYVPDESTAYSSAIPSDGAAPWPDWAADRERDGTRTTGEEFGSLIEEAEAGATAAPERESKSKSKNDFELRGSPSVSRVTEAGTDETSETGTDADTAGPGTDPRSQTELEEFDRSAASSSASAGADATATDSAAADEFGSLSGSSTTTRVTNDSFGSDVEWESEDDRYRALGAALGAGGKVSVRGLLEDEEFLPELPERERSETRIEFGDAFDPAAVSRAKAAAEQSGFVWVESGSLETTRVSNS
ncbi:hypothetical protein [Natrialba asiatica]|uniref:Uncharacterized protein n=1 Tax=Natrialba asiatica (strain ATCC 700177 / DSM 12278 / JCM 9576 / FERM P-10747 / NBRC 102637 / 172P1) TaxID=29540 RepID=M0AJV4_NATA1|nr:hypothetical protein [Natrialba asiatica]ELY98182.1 hypothetical protein C481_19650 [Natrialba asiatica DSM 12278]